MRRLIINADDLGQNPQRSHGIFQCMEFGIVTSASIIPCCSDSDRAARHARERNVSCGLHLNLTEEYPLSKPGDIGTLIEGNGRFMERQRLRAALDSGEVKLEHIEREIRAQVEWFFDLYGAPTHIDSHHHIHVWQPVTAALIPIMERYGIRSVRIPCEVPIPPWGFIVPDEHLEKVRRINARAEEARKTFAAHWIGSTDHFRGLTLIGNAALKNLRHIIGRLPESTTELMVHPGSACTYGTPFDLDPQRQTELRMLTDPSIPELLREKKVELISWNES